jgi:hypothetical protein
MPAVERALPAQKEQLLMTTITLEVPDELAAQFNIEPAHLPALIREAVEARLSKPARMSASPEAGPSLYQEIIDFLASNPTLEQVADFKISAPAQVRLEELLDKNREEGLTPEERTHSTFAVLKGAGSPLAIVWAVRHTTPEVRATFVSRTLKAVTETVRSVVTLRDDPGVV